MTEQNQLKSFGQLFRMREDRQVKTVWEAGTIPKRERWRPRTTWNNTVEEISNKEDHTIQTGKKLAQNKALSELYIIYVKFDLHY